MYLKSFIVRKFGPNTKIVWIPKAWQFQKNDMVHIEAKINGKTWHDTTLVKIGGSNATYVRIPPFWPIEIGDIIELGIVYATVHERPDDANPRAGH